MSGICLTAAIVALCLLIVYINRKQKQKDSTRNIYPSYHNTNIIQAGINPIVQLKNQQNHTVSFSSSNHRHHNEVKRSKTNHHNTHHHKNNIVKRNICNTCLHSTDLLNKTQQYQTYEWENFIKEQTENALNCSIVTLDNYEANLSTYIDLQPAPKMNPSFHKSLLK